MIGLLDVDGLTAGDLATRASTFPVESTVGALRDYFGASSSRRLAVLVDGERYVGAIARDDLADGVDGGARAADLAKREPVIEAARSGREARDAALESPSARLPVIDHHGVLVGVVALNRARDGFCGT